MQHKESKPIINVSGKKVLILDFPEALNKVFSQLITNSIEHAFDDTLTPGIDIEIYKVNGHVEIIYQDNGKGIDVTMVNDIFEPFYTTNMGNKSLGIGLSIVYNLVVQLMQGNIQCKAKQGKGIIFCITLPLIVR
jgi:signal transduction histidine kinase